MRILIAPDKFKDALSAIEAAKAIEEGIKAVLPQAYCSLLPLADGGEGTAALLTGICGGSMYSLRAHNPISQPVMCKWGYVERDKKGFIELAEASGLRLLPEHRRNPLYTSTYGTGELIKAAISMGAKDLVIGLGGSATNDGGCGMAAAMGYRFLDEHGKEIQKPKGKDLSKIKIIDNENIHPALKEGKLKVVAACDVRNPLLGPTGATYTYARQKGATEEILPFLEKGMQDLSEVMQKDLGIKVAEREGSGAAGGAGAGVLAFFNGELCSGSDLILKYSGFHQKIREVDLLITGEGKIDPTSLQGKLIGSISKTAKSFSVPVVAFCGSMEFSSESKKEDAFMLSIVPISLHESHLGTALQNSYSNLKAAAQQYFLEHFSNQKRLPNTDNLF